MSAGRTFARFVLGHLAGFAAVGAVLVATSGGPAQAHHTNFQGSCYSSSNAANYPMTAWRRTDARAYALVGAGEGYQWGGGCWNDNNVDDSPGDPTTDPTTRGEGPDCSGFTFKSWALPADGTAAYRFWHRMTNVHGPYNSTRYWSGDGPFELISKTRESTVHMDAFAKDGHVGLLYSEGTANNQDTILEAKCEACGTGIFTRTYRGDPAYRAVRRRSWTPNPLDRQ
jgi:hypothetical protein